MIKTIRIGTRDSALALWQATTVQEQLENLGYKTILVPIKSTGDIILDKPLYELGITGVFTRNLDIAMLNDSIDIAVHSMKDVPTILPTGIVEAAILKRGNVDDILVHKGKNITQHTTNTIATGSLRRKAQWLYRYPNDTIVDLRGNVNTRLQKLNDNDWNGAIFAAAGLERIKIKPENYTTLSWMIPAPAQGAMLVVAKEEDGYCRKALSSLNDKVTQQCVHIEREFLKKLEGGCTAPIGAIAKIKENKIYFAGALFDLKGQDRIEISKKVNINDTHDLGAQCAQEILDKGGKELMEKIKKEMRS